MSPKKAQRVSTYYKLNATQATLDFVDVRIVGDTPLFIDPLAISQIDAPWENSCTAAIQSYFQRVLDAISSGDKTKSIALLSQLSEDNSTRLGYSKSSRGSGVGGGLAAELHDRLEASSAIKSGLIADIEDTALLIEGIGEDRISDLTTNIIREQLVQYTQAAAAYYGIKVEAKLSIGPYWNTHKAEWQQATADLPLPSRGGPLLLVPKSIVRRSLLADPGIYYRHYVLNYLRDQELASGSGLVRVIKRSNTHWVAKKDVEAKYAKKHGSNNSNPGVFKRINLDATVQNPDLMDRFKGNSRQNFAPINAEELAETTGTLQADLSALLKDVQDCKPGNGDSTRYERAVEKLLAALFYPHLIDPRRQTRIHNDRKRIDITYTNAAKTGFFNWVLNHYAAANIMVECKNYSRPVGNPEFDQLSGRFSPSRGQVGMLVYRAFEDKGKILQSCRDTATDMRGFMLALDDGDLHDLVEESLQDGTAAGYQGLLRKRFDALIL